MPRKRTGTLERRGDEWHAKLTLDGGQRKRVLLGKTSEMSEARARDRLKLAVEIAAQDKRKAVSAKEAKPLTDATTVKQWGTDWTDGALLTRYGVVNKLRVKKSVRQTVTD